MFLSMKCQGSVLFVAAVCLASFSASEADRVDGWIEGGDQCQWTGPRCVTDCRYLPDGDYQSCRGCSIYASCVAGRIYDSRPCPAGTVWDDYTKHCNKTSRTCYCYPEPETCSWTGGRCIYDCKYLPDGDYQSCRGCSIYASCVAQAIIDYRPCAPANPPLQWDDTTKQCNRTSRTCRCYRDTETKPRRMTWSQILRK